MKRDYEKGKRKKLRNRAVGFVTALMMLQISMPMQDCSEWLKDGYLGNFLDLSGIKSFFEHNQTNTILTASAEESPTREIEDELWYDSATNSPITTIDFGNADDFIDYSYWYATNPGFASQHASDTLNIAFLQGSRSLVPTSTGAVYHPLGTSASKFNGSIQFRVADNVHEYTITSPAPLFDYVTDDAVIGSASVTLHLISTTNADVLLANHVTHGTGSASWSLVLDSENATTYSSVIGCMESGAKVNLDFTNSSGSAVAATAESGNSCNAGTICGTMQSGTELTVSYSGSSSAFNVTSAHGNAGGLVGEMQSATLILEDIPAAQSTSAVTASAGYAGGLVGYAADSSIQMATGFEVDETSADAIPVAGSVTGASGAGGLFGYYGNAMSGNTFDIKSYSNTASVYGQYCGGLFGVLENKMVSSAANTFTITDTTSSGNALLTPASGSGDTYDETGYFGGLIGRYTTDSLINSLVLSSLAYSAASADSFNAFGGAIGYIDTAAYVKADDVTITAAGTNLRSTVSDSCTSYAYFGGLVGATAVTVEADATVDPAIERKANGVLIDLGDFTLTVSDANGFYGGGVVGRFNNGVLRLSGTTTMTSAKPAGDYATEDEDGLRYASYGQLIGYNDNVLTYALGSGTDGTAYGSGWTFNRSNGALSDDLGTWGEVVRSITDSSNTGTIFFDTTNASTLHTVTLAGAKTSMSSADDFTRTALNIQLNQGQDYDCLKFTSGNNSRAYLLGTTLTILGDISLAGTGITGFMRDGTASMTSSDIGGVGTFTGTLAGGSKKITLAVGETYGNYAEGQTEGIGQIYRHRYNGLFSVIGNAAAGTGTVNNLTVAGTITVRNAGADGMSIGGISARSHGNTTLNAVSVLATGTDALTINYHEGANSPGTSALGKNLGGFIGFVDDQYTSETVGDKTTNTHENGTIAITGTSYASPNYVFTGSHQNWLVYGGMIGKIAAAKYTVNVEQTGSNNLTVGMQTDVTGVTSIGDNADCGGLIGYIISNGSYGERVVNIKNLIFNGCTISNCAKKTAGGFLGYSWLDTTANINGLTVTSGTINNTANSNTATDIGVMCYDATGKWIVDSLTVTAMTMNNGGGTSLGMLVNKAYHTVDSTTTGLYLDVLNSGYTLTNSGITLPASIGVFDELAAYSASDVITGGAGVVSVNMTTRAGTDPKITATGTYQNQLSRAAGNNITAINAAKYANSKARYYYNLDRMSNSVYGQNLLLWSVSKYAASNISSEFGTTITGTTFSGTADMTGLSFYPLKNGDSYTFDNLTLTFDYSGIYNTAEATFSTGVTTDGYSRDPAAKNQHYLMHSGLFMNLAAGKTITVNGKLSLAGTFLEVPVKGTNDTAANATSGYSGVIISRTMKGNFKCETGWIELAGITPKTTAAAAYTDGYLLINNIVRSATTDAAPEVLINNLYTGSGYPAVTTAVASSLLGAATGDDLKIIFSHVKLDARTTALSGDSGLDTAYNTSRSIFKDATLLHSIKTNPTAILEYYYTYAEDWADDGNTTDTDTNADRFVTYGKEVKDSAEYVNKEQRYYGTTRWYTNPADSTETGGVYPFSSGWLPYVATGFTAASDTAQYFRELKVNVQEVGPITGCGTYNHPYSVSGADLTIVAKFLTSGQTSDMQSIRLPKTALSGVAANAKGDRWCASKTGCAEFTLATTGTNSGKYVYTDSSTTPATVYTWTATDVRLYLANAYYVVQGEIELGTDFVGLGCATTSANGNYAFRGVIVGQTGTGGAAPKIINHSTSPLIMVSNGSVIKDLSIDVNVAPAEGENTGVITRSQSAAGYSNAHFGYNALAQYYGGIIGEVMGGDNIIDNSYVRYAYTDDDEDETDTSFATKIVLTDNGGNNAYGTLIPVGGYVGAVVFGGVIFKNMTASKTTAANTGLNVVYKTNTTNLVSDSAKQAIYVNPIVGRVINGYAVNETDTTFSVREGTTYHNDDNTTRTAAANEAVHLLKNGSKHYPITDIARSTAAGNPNASQLTVAPPTSANDNGTITVPNAQAMFILSLITQSGAGTATGADIEYTTSLSYGTYSDYVSGMSHIADYSYVGNVEAGVDKTDVADFADLASHDTAANTAVPYIIRYYTCAGERVETSVSTSVTVETSSFVESSTTVVVGTTVEYTSKTEIKSEIVTATTSTTTTTTTAPAAGNNAAKPPSNLINTIRNYKAAAAVADRTEIESTVETSISSQTSVSSYTSTAIEVEQVEVETQVATEYYDEIVPFTDDTIPDGKQLKIKSSREDKYLLGEEHYCNPAVNGRNYYLKSSATFDNATLLNFTKNPSNTQQYCIWFNITEKEIVDGEEIDVEKTYYLQPVKNNNNQGSLKLDTSPHYFTIKKGTGDNINKWYITSVEISQSINHSNKNDHEFCTYKVDASDGGNQLLLVTKQKILKTTTTTIYKKTTTITNTITNVVKTIITKNIVKTTTTSEFYNGYPARCVTSATGFYDITLTDSSYVLPDSFRGLGCVGNYNDQYKMKVDQFVGGGCTIDEDIYLNKFQTDNYFNNLHNGTSQSLSGDSGTYNVSHATDNHGIGLFDSIKTRGANASSKISGFTLTGSVNTEIFSNSYSAAGEVTAFADNTTRFISVGGVCGFSNNGSSMTFENIHLNGLSVCGSCIVGGLLGYSGNSANADRIYVTECRATDLKIKMNSGCAQDLADGKSRNAMGGFVGKVLMGKAIITGASTISLVTLDTFDFETEPSGSTVTDYCVTVGGLVGFAGNGCEVSNMKLSPSTGKTILIGGPKARYVGGLVGLMQPYKTGETSCEASFENCTVEKINLQGHYVGGFYGGKWINDFSPYKIELINCKVTGNSPTSKNTITGSSVPANGTMKTDGYVGGFLGCGNVYTNGSPNIEIKDCVISNYAITSMASPGYVGGMIGYAGSYSDNTAITCYMHDSSVENCQIGASGNYAGGIIGYINRNSKSTGTTADKILGYNIKLDNVSSGAGDNMGAWVGHLNDGDTKTTILFSGMAMYEIGYTKNIGDGKTLSNASFVFADYTGASKSASGTPSASAYNNTNNATMADGTDTPRYPYVTVFPQSAMGSSAIISSDGAKLLTSPVTDYADYTSANTIAAKLLADKLNTTGSRYYSTFANANVATRDSGSNTFESYFQKTTNSNGNRISTYETEKGSKPAGVDDFAVLTITNQDDTETTNLINRYIQLLTNTNTDYTIPSEYYNIAVQSCVYENGNFAPSNAAAGLTYTPGSGSTPGAFALNSAGIDSLTISTHKFTLIDVQFLNPFKEGTDGDKIVYHLYVPVFTIKSLNASFSSTVKSGTTYRASDYTLPAADYKLVMESFDNWITAKFRYTYPASEIQVLLNEGSLSWNSDKEIVLRFDNAAGGKGLTPGTELVLIDPNGGADKAYYAKGSDLDATTVVSGITYQYINLSDFHTTYSGGTSFSEQNLGDLIGGIVTVSDVAGSGKYESVESGDYDIKVGNSLYKFNADSTTGYAITANSAYTEDYYLSVRMPTSSNVYLFDILSSGQITGAIRTYVTNPARAYGAMLFGDLYENDWEVGTPTVYAPDGSQLITETNNKITVEVTSKIRLKDTNRSYFATLLNTNAIAVYHSNMITLNQHRLDGTVSNVINGTNSSSIKRTYTIGSQSAASTLNSYTATNVSDLNLTTTYIEACSDISGYSLGIQKYLIDAVTVNGTTTYPGAEITQKIEIDFYDIQSEFPERTEEQNNIGVNTLVSSNLSYVKENLPYSSKKANFTDGQYFYIEDTNSATLNLRADRDIRYDLFDVWGNASYNESLLGINGYSRSSTCSWTSGYQGMPVSATATYNTAGISNFESAKKVKYIIQLYKKTDVKSGDAITKVEYQKVNISDYLNHVVLTGGSVLTTDGSSTAADYVYVEDIYGTGTNNEKVVIANMEDQIFTAKLDFEVKTGGDFKEYANYQVRLIEELLDERGNVISNSLKSDHIVYTNAKIRPEYLVPTT